MDSFFEHASVIDLDNPPTLVAEEGKVFVEEQESNRMSTESSEDKTAMPVLQPNICVESGTGTRSKSGRIRKPARNFMSDEYVVPNLVKRRIPANSRTSSAAPAKSVIQTNTASSSAASSSSSSPSTAITNTPTPLSASSFEELANELIRNVKSKDKEIKESTSSGSSSGNSMVAALHATLQKDGGPEFDPSQYEPPGLEKDSPMFSLDDMDESENSCNFFESIKEPSFDTGTPPGLTDEAFAELEQHIESEVEMKSEPSSVVMDDDFTEAAYPETDMGNSEDTKFDADAVEIEESSGSVRLSSGPKEGDFTTPGATMISIKTALLCALKISEDFLPSSHEKYLDRLEEMDKYLHEDLDDIRRKLNMRPSPHALKRKMKLNVEAESSKKAKVALKVLNGSDKPKTALPFLRSAYAKCRKFMEDETTVIEKLGNNKILAAGKVIEIEYEKYLKEADVEIPFDDTNSPMPSLPPPTVSNCHAPSCRLGCICSSISEDMPPRKHCGRPRCFFECTCQNILFNSSDDGDIRSRLRPRVSLLNWRAESTEKEKEPMTSYRQMERGTHFIRMRRNAAQPERLRREFVLDGKIVDRSAAKVSKDRLRTKALLQSSHRRIMAKPGEGHRFGRIGAKQEFKAKVNVDQMKKKCTPLTVDVEHMNVESADAKNKSISTIKRRILTPEQHGSPKMTAKDIVEMKSIIQEMTEDYQLLVIDGQVGFFSWAKGIKYPKVIMYQVKVGDQAVAPWLYLPIPPQGHSWLCHQLNSTFEDTDYVYIPEVKCSISSKALKININTAIAKKKPVVFDVKSCGNQSGMGKIYFFPDIPNVLICGPFKTEQTPPGFHRDLGNAEKVYKLLDRANKEKTKALGDHNTWNEFSLRPTIFPMKKRNDRETPLDAEESKKLFDKIYPSIIRKPSSQASDPRSRTPSVGDFPLFKQPPKPIVPKVALDWSKAVKLVGIPDRIPNMNKEAYSLTEIITL